MKIKTIISAIFTAIMPLTACASDNEPDVANNSDNMTINITIEGKTMTANIIDNSSTKALIEKLQQGNVTYTANHCDLYDGGPEHNMIPWQTVNDFFTKNLK